MYGYTEKVDLEFNEAYEKVVQELKKEGFGVLTLIDVKATLKKKLNVDSEKYIILGACNPSLDIPGPSSRARDRAASPMQCNRLREERGNTCFCNSPITGDADDTQPPIISYCLESRRET